MLLAELVSSKIVSGKLVTLVIPIPGGAMSIPAFIDRERELQALEDFWSAGSAQCIPVTGRRRVGKTFLLEHFAQGKQVVYYRCQLGDTAEQLPLFGAA